MPDPDPSTPLRAPTRAQNYPIGSPAATPSLEGILRDRITREGPLRFPDFMEVALYHPTLGYYARETRQVGRGGDFFTSVSVGPLFGNLLARRFLRAWKESGSPTRWRIIECGAHDGTLAADVIGSLQMLDSQAFESFEYAIPEPLPLLQAAQRETLREFGNHVRFISHPTELASDPLPGIAFGNELLDALPFHIVEWQGNVWKECRVTLDSSGGLTWQTHEIHDPLLHAALAPLGACFPEGYRTEVRTCFPAILEPLARCLQSGLMIWADYGFSRSDYYHPARRTGTLRTFSKHRAGENPLASPGEIDITAHVDFTAVAEAAVVLGGRATVFRNQGSWLIHTAREWLLEQEGAPCPQSMRQFQTLTHPAHLGGDFHFMELTWNPGIPLEDASSLTHRLFEEPL